MNRCAALFITLVLTLGASSLPAAPPQDEGIVELKKKIEDEKKEIEKLAGQEKDLKLSLSQIVAKLKDIKNRVKIAEKRKQTAEAELRVLYGENEKLSRILAEKRQEIERRLVVWHKTYLLKTETPFLDLKEPVLFENYMKTLFQYDRGLIDGLTENRTELQRNMDAIRKKRDSLTAIETELKHKRSEQESLEKRQTELLKTTRTEKAVHAKNLKNAEQALRKLEALLKKAEELPQYAGRGLGKGILPYPLKGEIVGHFGIEHGESKGAKFTRKGIEIAGRDGASVRSVDNGKIVYTGWIRNLGNICIISHGRSFYTVYGRLGSIAKNKGDEIGQGEILGTIGKDSSFFEFPTLYFEIREKEKPLNPEQWLR